MKLIIGLGNPGKKYENTRHNLGFMFIDKILEKLSLEAKKCKRTDSFRKEALINHKKVMLTKPRTFMNLAGRSVRKLVNLYKARPQDIWVIYDDLDLPLGKIRIRQKKSSSGGHQGIASIIQNNIGEFNRIKIGIGSNREKNIPAEKYVLQKFTRKEKGEIEESIAKAITILERII